MAETNITWQQVGNRMVFDVVQEEDSGTYECNATNRAGISSKNISIEVSFIQNNKSSKTWFKTNILNYVQSFYTILTRR